MSAFYIMIVASVLVAGAFLGAFIWSVKTDQFEDRQGTSMRMLYEDELEKTN